MPRGGMAAREIVAKTISDRLSEKTGLDFGMPAITPAVLPGRYLQPRDRQHQIPNTPVYGSIQNFANAPRGSFGAGGNGEDTQLIASVPKEETQKIALLDMI